MTGIYLSHRIQQRNADGGEVDWLIAFLDPIRSLVRMTPGVDRGVPPQLDNSP